MVNRVHALIYRRDAEGARAFFRDVLGWRWVDAGFGLMTALRLPGGSELGLYQPRHAML